jgi:hypothetical protein
MKWLFLARRLLIDCGRASRQTRGAIFGVFSEAGAPPNNRRVS